MVRATLAFFTLVSLCHGAVHGRFVRIELPQRATPVPEGRILSVCEIQVFRGAENVALRGTATQSKGRTPATVAIDGVTDEACTHSDVGARNPWLEVDLGETVPIDVLVVWNRQKLHHRLHGFLVTVLDGERRVVWHQRFPESQRGAMRIAPATRKSAFVGVLVAAGAAAWYDVRKEVPADRGNFLSGTLLGTGHYDRLPTQTLPATTVNVDLGLPADAAERRARFARRNSDAAIETLCSRLQSVLKPDVPALKGFRQLCRSKRHREALDAYRAYFFDKLAHPEKYGAATESIFFEQVRSRGRGALLVRPNPLVIDHIMEGRAVQPVRKETVVGAIGPPGAVNWAPRDLAAPEGAVYTRGPDRHAFWSTDDGKTLIRKIELCRALNQPCSMYGGCESFEALVSSYAVTGNTAHLQRWLEYLDDWRLHAKRDVDACPSDVRRATELETQAFRTHLNLLRLVLDERPALATAYPAATLARYLMALVTELPPYLIRAKRAELANWGIMGICHLLHVTSFLNEFKAMDYYRRETWRLWRANFIQHRTLDGENCEAWDLGHNGVDIGYALDSVPYCTLPPGADEWARREFWDLVRINERNQLVHMSPNGKYWPRWFPDGGFRGGWRGVPDRTQSALTLKYLPLDERERSHLDLILDEPGALARVDTILGGTRRPDRFSDMAPYAAMYYLRDSWEAGAEYLLMQDFRYRSQDTAIRDVSNKNRFGGSARTQYTLSKAGRVLVAASPIVVDGKPDNRWHNAIPTGGKTNVCGETGRRVVGTRFHTSDRFDLAEAKQDAPYCRPEVKIRGDWYGHYTLIPGKENEPVTDVTTWRQVFRLRGTGLTIVSDRIESGGEHEYTQFFALPVCIPERDIVKRVVELAEAGERVVHVEADRLWTTNAGFGNVTVRLFGPKLQFANRIGRRGEHQALEKSQIQILQDAIARKQSARNLIQRYCKRPVSARWTGKGNQALVAALDTVGLRECRPLGSGFEAVTDGGARVAFQAGPDRRNRLAAGPVIAEAETLLAVERAGELSGIVLSCTAFAVRGKSHVVTVPDFEYVLPKDGDLAVTPIHRPIDTVEIRPAANVFTDSVQVSFAIPTQDTRDIEFRYTLDGAEPTLESARFTAPFTLRATAMVKVRPFRKGLKATPWHFTGTECGKTITTIFRKERLRPRSIVGDSMGPQVEYMEGDWPTLFAYAGSDGVLDVKARAPVKGLLLPAEVAALRKTDGPYALRYRALLNVPASGVYAFHAPEHLYSTTMDAGYDLRVWVDGEEWSPAPRLHSEHTWFIPLEKGLHSFKVSFVDYRTRPFRNEYWMAWRAEEMWGGIPVLEVTGPDGRRQPLPAEWLW